jgi:hypothetical protein
MPSNSFIINIIPFDQSLLEHVRSGDSKVIPYGENLKSHVADSHVRLNWAVAVHMKDRQKPQRRAIKAVTTCPDHRTKQ